MPAKLFTTNYPSETSAPYPVTILTQPPWYDFTKQNGYIKLAKTLHLRVESDRNKLRELWEQFSPNVSAFDLWDVRRAFADGYQFDPYFVTLFIPGKDHENVVGILPLSVDEGPEPPKYIWFGSNWPEDNTFFVNDPELIPLLLFAAPESLRVDCIQMQPKYEFLKTVPGFSKDKEKKYFLDISKYATLADYLTILKKKKRYNIKRDRKRIQSLSPTIQINTYDHIEELFRLNILRFRQKFNNDPDERSTFENDRQKDAFRNLVKNAGKYQARIISTIINGEVAAVELGLAYNKTYYALNAGAAIAKYSGIGVYSNCLVLEDAQRLGCTKIDFLEGHSWKDSWKMNYCYQYQFSK